MNHAELDTASDQDKKQLQEDVALLSEPVSVV